MRISAEHLARLNLESPRNVWALSCPDCGAPMQLRLSIYGRFYGCSTFKDTNCKGSLAAGDDGTPLGDPADKPTRALRKVIMDALEKMANPIENRSHKVSRIYRWRRLADAAEVTGGVGRLDFRQCQKVICYLNTGMPSGPTTIWSRLVDDGPDIVGPDLGPDFSDTPSGIWVDET